MLTISGYYIFRITYLNSVTQLLASMKTQHSPLHIYLPNPPPPTAHMPSYTAICVISLSNSVVLNYVLHESTN